MLALLATIGLASQASAARSFDVGFADYLYGSLNAKERNLWLNRTEQLNAGTIRVNLYWSSVTRGKPEHPRDPADPAYDFNTIDNAVEGAHARGLDVLLTVMSAPSWAEGPNRPPTSQIRSGAWDPDPAAFGDFAHALAVRYSGHYSGPAAGTGTGTGGTGGIGGLPLPLRATPLPEVEYLQAWNEPNLNTYLAPQWDGKRNVASDIYSRLLNRFYAEVKAVNPDVKVVSAGTAPYGDPPGGPNRTRPLRFYRELLCLNAKLKKAGCPAAGKPKADIFAHHPINREDPPTAHALAADDVEIADFGELTKTVRRAERQHTIATGGRHQLWADELWWQTNPPDRDEGIPLKKHARWTAQGLYLLWKQGASRAIFLQFRDSKYRPGEPSLASYQTGVYTYSGKKKPTADAVKFPFVTDRKSKSRVLAWGKAPASGKLTIEVKRGKRFQRVASLKARDGKVFTETIRLRGKAKLRARVGKKKSLVWSQKG